MEAILKLRFGTVANILIGVSPLAFVTALCFISKKEFFLSTTPFHLSLVIVSFTIVPLALVTVFLYSVVHELVKYRLLTEARIDKVPAFMNAISLNLFLYSALLFDVVILLRLVSAIVKPESFNLTNEALRTGKMFLYIFLVSHLFLAIMNSIASWAIKKNKRSIENNATDSDNEKLN